MNEHTKKLLEECNSGCKMAIASMKQAQEHVHDQNLYKTIETYCHSHEQIEVKTGVMLCSKGEEEKEPGIMAQAFSKFSAGMKFMADDSDTQAAKLMMDGCNMGIQTISECRNEYSDASREADTIAQNLIDVEEKFMGELEQYL